MTDAFEVPEQDRDGHFCWPASRVPWLAGGAR